MAVTRDNRLYPLIALTIFVCAAVGWNPAFRSGHTYSQHYFFPSRQHGLDSHLKDATRSYPLTSDQSNIDVPQDQSNIDVPQDQSNIDVPQDQSNIDVPQDAHNQKLDANSVNHPRSDSTQNSQSGQNRQSGKNSHSGQNSQSGINSHSGQNSQSGQNRQSGINIHSGQNRQSGINIHSGQNSQLGINIHSGQNSQSGINIHSGQNSQSGINIHLGQFSQSGQNIKSAQNCQSGQNSPETESGTVTKFKGTANNLPTPVDLYNTLAHNTCPGSCLGRCGKVSFPKADALFPCHCDLACWLYGDCCIDYYAICLHTNINATDDKILKATLGDLQDYSQLLNFRDKFHWSSLSSWLYLTERDTYFQIVAKCSSETDIVAKFHAVYRDLTDPVSDSTKYFMGLSRDEIKKRCEGNDSVYSNLHILDQTHVTLSRDTAVHFYNVFCAICNGVMPSQVSPWTTNVTCDSQTLNQTDTTILFTDNSYQNLINNNCTILNIDDIRYPPRPCFPYKEYVSYSTVLPDNDSSDDSGMTANYHNSSCCEPSDDSNTVLCKRYQFAYLNNITLKAYKNPHCRLCSLRSSTLSMNNAKTEDMYLADVNLVTTVCRIDEPCKCHVSLSHNYHLMYPNAQLVIPAIKVDNEDQIPTEIPSFRVLLDFRASQTTVTVNETIRIIETKSCPQGQGYEPLLDICRQVRCLPGAQWQDNRCVPVNDCPEIRPGLNKTCHRSTNQTLDYSYFPFPDGSVHIRLIVILEYIFGPVGRIGSTLNNSTLISSIHSENNNGFKIQTDTKIHSENSTNMKCSVLSKRLNHLFTFPSLKRMWMKQMQNKNSTKVNKKDYNDMMTIVRQRINATVHSHVKNQSLNVKTVFCSGSTCLTDGVPLLQNDTFSNKRPSHNPCLESPTRTSKSRKRVHRSDECLSFGIHLESSANLDVILKAVKVMVSDITTVAHDNNFLVSRLDLTNSFEDRSDLPTREDETQPDMGINEGFTASSSQPCQRGELVIFNETNVELSQNGTYVVHFNGLKIPLGAFSFNVELYINPTTSEGEVKVANISWCQTDFSKLRCESLQVTMYNSSNFVFINGTLVLTNMAATFTQFLDNNATRTATLDELVSLFPSMFVGGNATIVKAGQYIKTRSGVLVCSNFSNTYSKEKEIITTFERPVFMPDSEAEIIATYLSSVISITCLTGTLVVYSFMPSLQNVPGKIVMSLSAAILCAHIMFLACEKPEGLACEIYAAFHHAVWLASFAWLTALSVNLAYILNSQSIHCDTSRSNIFKLLSAVCWGVPLMFSGICFVLFKANFVSIGYGQNGVCWIGNMQSLLLTFGVPVFLIIAVTAMCAVSVVKAIGGSLNFRSKCTASRRKSRKQIIVCVNLSLLMGFNWLFYFLAVGVNNTVLWALHSLINGSQGLYIFLCFIARKSLWLKLVAKLKLGNMWSRKSDHSLDSPKAKMAATITTPLSSPCSSINLKYLNNQTKHL